MRKAKATNPSPKRVDVDIQELIRIVALTQTSTLSDEERYKLNAAVATLTFLTEEIKRKGATIAALRKLLFGPSTEKTSHVLAKASGAEAPEGGGAGPASGGKTGEGKAKGHGRNGAAAYTGAARVRVSHETLQAGQKCPGCEQGKVYPMSEPAVLVRVTGVAPLTATVYECERLRCNACGEVFTARAPPGVGEKKYDETVASMIALLKYGLGVPFNRIEVLQGVLGIPLPAATQWDLVEEAAERVAPAYEELIRQAAQGDILHNDDTTSRILALMGEEYRAAAKAAGERTGLFTTGIVSVLKKAGCKVALFITGQRHAGENLKAVLSRRAAGLPPPIQMCDALSRNVPGAFETILANCQAHARRYFVNEAENFPEQCAYVLETLREVYRTDARAREWGLDDIERMRLHQGSSGPRMKQLHGWLAEQFLTGRVEPNSALGTSIAYMLGHWEELTAFLRVPGAPLDNNVVERALKKAVLHRKNALFFKTLNGARVGDMFMSLVHTAELNGSNPFEYLVRLQQHEAEVAADPAAWMPWNYQAALTRQRAA